MKIMCHRCKKDTVMPGSTLCQECKEEWAKLEDVMLSPFKARIARIDKEMDSKRLAVWNTFMENKKVCADCEGRGGEMENGTFYTCNACQGKGCIQL